MAARRARRIDHRLFEAIDIAADDHTVGAPAQRQTTRSIAQRGQRNDRHPRTFPRHQQRRCPRLGVAADRLNIGGFRNLTCSRNDAIGNAAVIGAAELVAVTGTPWPDLAVAALMGWLFTSSAWSILRQARAELRAEAVPA